VSGEFGFQGSHGGRREEVVKYGPEDQQNIRVLLWMAIKKLDPLMHIKVTKLGKLAL